MVCSECGVLGGNHHYNCTRFNQGGIMQTKEDLLVLLEAVRPRLVGVREGDNSLNIWAAVAQGIEGIGRAADFDGRTINETKDDVRARFFDGTYERVLDVARTYFELEGDGENG